MTGSDSRLRHLREDARRYPVMFMFEFFFIFVGVGALFEYVWGLVAGRAPKPLVGGEIVVAALAAVLFTLAWRQRPRARAETQSVSGA